MPKPKKPAAAPEWGALPKFDPNYDKGTRARADAREASLTAAISRDQARAAKKKPAPAKASALGKDPRGFKSRKGMLKEMGY